jgi:hypothetical protein
MERENFTHICVVQVLFSFNLYIVYNTEYCQYTVLFDYNIKYVLYFATTICVRNV